MLAVAESGVEDANVVGVRDAIKDEIGAAVGGKVWVWEWSLMGFDGEKQGVGDGDTEWE